MEIGLILLLFYFSLLVGWSLVVVGGDVTCREVEQTVSSGYLKHYEKS